jgi:acetoacetate decarboxylase
MASRACTFIRCITIGYKHRAVDGAEVLSILSAPHVLLKMIPHVDGSPRIAELVRVFDYLINSEVVW